MKYLAESILIGVLVIIIVAAIIVMLSVVTSAYSDAQEVTPEPTATATPTIFDALPTQMYHHSSDVNFNGSVNIVDIYIVAGDIGETGAAAACAHVITGSAFDLVSCP